MTHPLPPKKEVALALLERSSVHVHLDPRAAGVVVPPSFKRQPQLVLQIGLNMPVPIPDLRLDDDGMSCTLSFNRSPFFCIVPWASVFAMVGDDGRGMVWPDDVPQEIAKTPASEPDVDAAVKTAASADAKPHDEPSARASRARRGPAAAEDKSANAAKTEKGKKGKKRRGAAEPEAELRPMLVAVSQPAPRPAPRAEPAPLPVPRAEPAQPAPRAEPRKIPPPAIRRPQEGSGKPKRELPPYLRVVK